MFVLGFGMGACAPDGMTTSATDAEVVALQGVELVVPAAVAGDVVPAAPQPPALLVRSGNAAWDLAARTVVFHGDVQAVRGDLTLTCDDLVVRYERPERLESAVATGHVSLLLGGRRLTATNATLDVATGRLDLTGSPVLEDGPQRLEGRRMVAWLDSDRLECEGCTLVVQGSAFAPVAPVGTH